MPSKLTYEDMHWGDSPSEFPVTPVLADCSGTPLGECAAISYATRKAGKPGIWRHPFTQHNDGSRNRGPFLLELDEGGQHRIGPGPGDESSSQGLVIDVELADDRRAFISDVFGATDDEGSALWLVGRSEIPVQIEAREEGPIVTAHGIER